MEAIKSTSLNSGFPRFFIELGTVDTSRKITDRLEGSVFIALRDNNIFYQGLTHTFNRSQPETNGVFATDNTEVGIRLINIWAKYLNPHAFTFSNLNRQTISPTHIRGHQCSHEGIWIVCLKIGRPISYQTITRGVRLVETVVREVEQLRPESFSLLLSSTTHFLGTFNKFRLHLIHQVDFLFTHRLTQSICLTTGKATPFLRDLHELLLIDQNTVGGF